MKFQERVSLDYHEHIFLSQLTQLCRPMKRSKVLSLIATAGIRAIEHEPEKFGVPLRFKIDRPVKKGGRR